mmetsp:Transcript_29711/g.63635  ORF Transcript_29711/g.63635 Transcript_29711/m.63635 type:complete len:218 (+) Transcript_29711:93-746(+)
MAFFVLNKVCSATSLAASAPCLKISSRVSGSLRTSWYRSWMGFRWAITASARTGLNSPHDIPPTSSRMSSLVRLVGWTAAKMLRRLVASGRSGLSHSMPGRESVLHRLILSRMVLGSSRTLIREVSEGSLLDILEVPSVRLMTRDPSLRMMASGSTKTGRDGIPAALHRFLYWFPLQNMSLNRRTISRVNSKCCLWSSPTGTFVDWYNMMSAPMRMG